MGDIVTYGAVDEPAEFTRVELPGRTLLLLLIRAFFNFPTVARISPPACFSGKQEKELSFNVAWDGTPPLFIATDRFERDSQQAGCFFLCFV